MSAKSARTEPGRRSARRAWLPTAVVALAFLALAAPWGRFRDRHAPPHLSSTGVAFNDDLSIAPTTVTKQIAQIHVGDWVLAHNPEVGVDERARADDAIRPEDNPSQWRAIGLILPKKHGGSVNIELLRPAAWVDERGVATGAQIDIALLELGASGLAQVLWVGPCPEIGAQPAPGCRVVTGTFAHSSADTFNLTVAGVDGQLDQTIGVTGNHPIWSEDKHEFIPVSDLAPGEHLVTATGDATRVVSVLPRPGPEPVYNLEVDVEHVYYVSSAGVLAHNTCPDGAGGDGPEEVGAPDNASRRLPRNEAALAEAALQRNALGESLGRSHAAYAGGEYGGKVAVGHARPGLQGGMCAEDAVAAQLGSKANFHRTYGWRPNRTSGELEWAEIPVCTRCQGKYSPEQFPGGTLFEPNGPWSGK